MRFFSICGVILAFWLTAFSTPLFCAEEGLAPGEASGTDAAPPYETLDSLFNLYQPYLENISAYEPIYFLVGADPGESKFQISLKYRFLNPDMPISDKYPWINGFHIAYTQTSYWDLRAESEPFEDTSYRPELFYLSPNLFSGAGATHTFIQVGYQHESNGQGGDLSRSTNTLYVKPIFIYFHRGLRIGIEFAPRIWTYLANDDETNPDLYDYRGYADLELKFGRTKGAVFETHWYWGDEGISVRHDLTYPLDRLIDTNLQIYLHAQYVNALAESLLNYQDRTRAFRLGISIVR